MSKDSALRLIKALRDAINDTTSDDGWANEVCYHLDHASDVIEFPLPHEKGG